MNGDEAPAPEPYVRRKAPTLPPPAPGSAARKALEHKIVELGDVFDSLDDEPRATTDDVLGGAELDLGDDDDDDDDDEDEPAPPPPPVRTKPPTPPPPARAAVPPPAGRPRALTGQAPTARPRPRYDGGDPLDLSAIPASDKTQENRGAVGMRHDKSGPHAGALTTNAVSGTIGDDDTPAPIFDRAAIAAGQQGAIASERVGRIGAATGARTGTAIGAAAGGATSVRTAAATGAQPTRGTAPLADAPPNATVVGTGVASRGAASDLDRRPLPSAPPSAPAPFWPSAAPLPSAPPPAPEPSWPTPSSTAKPQPAAELSNPTHAIDGAPDDSGVLLAAADKPVARDAARDDESGILVSGPDKKLAARDDHSEIEPPAQKRSFFGRSVGPAAAADKSIAAKPITDRSIARPIAAPPRVSPAAPDRQPEPRRRSPTSSVPALLQAPLVPSGRTKRPTAAEPLEVVEVVELDASDSIVELDASALSADDRSAQLAVPVGERDPAQTTVARDPASTLLGVPPAPDEVRGDPTFDIAPGAGSERGDPTAGDAERGDATAISGDAADPTIVAAPSRAAVARPTGGTLRSSAALPRRDGLFGDIRYVATVVFGVRRANRELAALDAKQATRQQSRRHHLMALGRAAVMLREWRAPSVAGPRREHPALGPARTQLEQIEAERDQHAAQVVDTDEELAHVRADRDAAAKQHTADLAAIDTELTGLAKKLEPLEREATAVRKRGAELHASLRQVDAKIAATETSLRHPKGGRDPVELQAELATLKADRKSIQRDEPVIAGELDALTPRIAAIEAARADARSKRTELERADAEDQRRVADLLAAIGAKRKVVERAVTDAETARDKILLALGERLYVDRPDDLSSQLAPIDEVDVELGVADRRMMELRELTASVDRWKVARGVLWLIVIFGALGTAAWFLIPLFS